MSWEDVMGGLTKKRKREEEMEGEIGDLATENALLRAEVKKLKSEKKSLEEGVGGAAVDRFEGTCPLCGEKFMDAMLLETHASECDGGGEPEQVTCFVFPSKIYLRCRSHRLSSPCHNPRLVHQPEKLYYEL